MVLPGVPIDEQKVADMRELSLCTHRRPQEHADIARRDRDMASSSTIAVRAELMHEATAGTLVANEHNVKRSRAGLE